MRRGSLLPSCFVLTHALLTLTLYSKANVGFGAIGAMLEHDDGFIYGHINQINVGHADGEANASGVCAFRTSDIANPRSFRGWNGTEWSASLSDNSVTSPPEPENLLEDPDEFRRPP